MTTLTTVPEGATVLDVLATRYRIAFDKTQAGREQWIEGTLELAIIVAEARKMIPDHREFSRWISRNRLEHFHPNEFAALKGFNQDLIAAREMLKKSNSISWRVIWEKRPNRTLTNFGKGAPRPKSRRSGSSQRKRRIPDAMRDDDDQPAKPSAKQPRPEPKGINLRKGLTREQVDPDFKGTHIEFKAKYGHVNLHTKQEIEQHKQQEKLSVLLGAMTEHARTARELITGFADIDADTLRAWQQKTGKAEKWQTWCKDIALACEYVRKALD